MYVLVLVALILIILFKILNVNNCPQKSLFYCANGKFLEQILQHAPTLSEPYTPTRLWGYSGHIQTIIQGALSRFHCPLVDGKRYFFKQHDGTTVTYDLYQPIEQHSLNGDFTLALCPGICNSSESVYIRRVVRESQLQGYRVAVLNHVGVLKGVPVTSPRIFSYGDTSDYEGMVQDLFRRFPATSMVCVGFSMGGNIITKYLGEENKLKPNNIMGGISICQGYDAVLASQYLLNWEGFRRLYFFAMTENIKAILRRWQRQLFTDTHKRERGIIEKDVWCSATMVELDDSYTRKLHGSDSVENFYKSSSSIHYFDGIKVPMIFLNAEDDPLIPPPLTRGVKMAAMKNDLFLYIEQKYGGHLGFYEGGLIYPNNTTWLDRALVEMSNGLAHGHYSSKLFPSSTSSSSSSPSSTDDEDDDVEDTKTLYQTRPRFVISKKNHFLYKSH